MADGSQIGTWLDSDNGMLNGKRQVESNVTRISRAIKPYSDDGIQQVVYYHKGIGSNGGMFDRALMGICEYCSILTVANMSKALLEKVSIKMFAKPTLS
jgi:Uncharacterized alpha/beta hydrolase domain (DUF2235)